MNSAQGAEFLNVSSRTLQRLRDQGKVRYYQDSRIIRYKVEDLEEYLLSNVMEPFERKEVKNG